MIGQGYVFKKVGDKMFDQDTAKIVKRHAFWASMVMMTPFEVFDSICYVIILWHMYSKLCERANTSLNFGNIVAGVIINVIIAAVISALCIVFFPITGIVVYLQFYMSGKGYISTLKNVMGYNYPDTPTVTHNQTTIKTVPPAYNQLALTPTTNTSVPPAYNLPAQEATPGNKLLTCPECGQMVSRRADACSNCGCPISEMNQ